MVVYQTYIQDTRIAWIVARNNSWCIEDRSQIRDRHRREGLCRTIITQTGSGF